MTTEHGKIDGDLEVSGPFALHGMVTGSIVVQMNGDLKLHGMCCHNLVVNEGGTAFVHGMVNGNAVNKGGVLHISGTVGGELSTLSGQTYVIPGALINGIRA